MVKTLQIMEKELHKKNFEDLINSGVNVITSGNHIWDQKRDFRNN